MTLLQKLQAIVAALTEISALSPVVQTELTTLNNFLDSI